MEKFQSIQSEIYDFLETANAALPREQSLFFGGTFLTGALERPDFLFIGINPGYGEKWGDRRRHFTRTRFQRVNCKYVDELQASSPLAIRVVGLLLGNKPERLGTCAETSMSSFFGSPNSATLDGQFTALSDVNLKDRHDRLMTKALETIVSTLRPKNIVCVGLGTFQNYLRRFGDGKSEIITERMKSESGKTQRTYYNRATIEGCPVHGLIHLSGARPSNKMMDEIKGIFSTLDT